MSAISLYRAEGIILRTRPMGEADRVLTIFTREEGLIEAVARGARRSRSRMVGATMPFTQVQMLLFRGKSLDNLSQTEILRTFSSVRDDLMRMAYGTYWCELMAELMPAREPNEGVYLFFLAALLLLEASDDPGILSGYFELRLMAELGYRPGVDQCAVCGRPAGEWPRGSFLPESGSLLCDRCSLANASGKPLSGAATALLRSLLTWDMRRLGVLKPESTALREVRSVLRAFIGTRVGRPLKSLAFLEGLESQA